MTSSQQVPAALPKPLFAGLASRLAAYLLDALISLLLLFLVAFVLLAMRVLHLWTLAGQGRPPEEIWRSLGVSAKLAVVFVYVLSLGPMYLALFEASPWQASFGKRMLNIYVTDDETGRIGVARALGRWAAKWIFACFLLWPISMIAIAASEKKQALHDFAAKTLVLKGRPMPGGTLEPWRILAAFGIPFVWILGTFLATL